MFKNAKFKKIVVSTLVMLLVIGSVAIAANNVYEKKLTATHGRIKFMVDGKDVTKEIESKYSSPAFTVKEYNDRSYVPVRGMAELMGMEIKYDAKTHTAEFIDSKSKKYLAQIASKDKEIEKLEKQIRELKKEVVEEEKEGDIKTLEKALNKDYGNHKNVDFSISLKEGTSRIDVDIITDLRSYREEDAWIRMVHSERKAMVEGIVNKISREFPSMAIYGSIYDNHYRENLLTFNQSKNGSLNVYYSGGSSSSDNNGDIEFVVEKEFERERIYDVYVSKASVTRNNITFDIDIAYIDRAIWNGFTNEEKVKLLDRVSNEIERYNYSDRDYDRNRDIDIRVYVDNKDSGRYFRGYNETKGVFK